jgi:hypothetical protein
MVDFLHAALWRQWGTACSLIRTFNIEVEEYYEIIEGKATCRLIERHQMRVLEKLITPPSNGHNLLGTIFSVLSATKVNIAYLQHS